MIYDIVNLDNVNNNTELWGGKAVALSELKRNGFFVPNGFVISSNIYMQYIYKVINIDDFRKIIEYYYSYFQNNREVIFRSSANLEGLLSVPCCGIFNSYLEDNSISLYDNIKKVWDSTSTQDVKSYLNRSNVSRYAIKMAVLVQEIVKKKYTAVIQTFDIIRNRNQIIVEYSSGAIDSIVNGECDAYIVWIQTDGTVKYSNNSPCLNQNIIDRIINDCQLAERILSGHLELEAQIDESEIVYIQARII